MFLTKIRFKPGEYPAHDVYPFNIEIFRSSPALVLDTPVTFFVGENGSGKSTLLKAISHKCGIYIWGQAGETRAATNRFENDLCEYIEAEWVPVPGAFFASEIFRHFALLLEEWSKSDPGQLQYWGGESLVTRSHGQSHMAFFKNRFTIKGLYLLDEPENALSPDRQLELAGVLSEMAGRGHAQFIVCTHSPLLMSVEGAKIFDFDSAVIEPIKLERTRHYRTFREFFAGR
jgi:predicted ATPase